MEQQLAAELAQARREIEFLQRRLDAIEGMPVDADVPQTMLLDHSFLKRAFAVWGHNFVASLVIAAAIYLPILLLIALVAGFGR